MAVLVNTAACKQLHVHVNATLAVKSWAVQQNRHVRSNMNSATNSNAANPGAQSIRTVQAICANYTVCSNITGLLSHRWGYIS